MNKIATTIGSAALVVSLSACTPSQIAYFMGWKARVEATPDTQDDQELLNVYAALPPTPITGCNEWFWTSIEAGWSVEDWPFLAHILPRESNCDPGAHNASGASGLAQVMPMWADDCDIATSQLFDPLDNLRCAKHVFDVQGPNAWSTWP